MQIILVQTEVEQALRNYVASRLTLAVGTTFSIDLAATRGANGITATIDLVEPGQTPPVAAPAPVGKLAGVKPETAPKAVEAVQTTQVASAAVATQEQATAPAADVVETAVTAAAPAAEETETATAAAPAEAAQTGEAAPAGTKSLFGNLGRPKNS